VGRAFDVFIILENGESLFFIDHHAAHERLRYDRFMAQWGKKQTLLVPYVVETSSSEDDAYLEGLRGDLEQAGFELHPAGEGRWECNAVSAGWEGTEDDLQRDLLEKRLNPARLAHDLAAVTACRGAAKEGHYLDGATAADLGARILESGASRCPHGRPIWFTLKRDELYRHIQRIE
jgi:DNA mismatch repair protein MutL